MPPIHPTVLACVAVLGLLLFGLGLAVSGARGRSNLLTARTLRRPSPLRFVGAAGTYGVGLWLSALLVVG